METTAPAVSLRNIRKAFGGVQALRGVSFEAEAGAVTALVGENGAGKSTLLNVLAGGLEPDTGEVFLAGKQVDLHSPALAQRAGIAIMHQELNTLPHLSVAENIYLNRLPMRGPIVDWRRLHEDCRLLLARLEVDLNPRTPMGQLSTAKQQMVEVARAIAQNARIIAMDEPTASLASEETRSLFRLIDQLKSQGVAIIFVSHRLEEVFEISDIITVLRDGQTVGSLQRAAARPEQVIELMVGRAIDRQFPKVAATPGNVVLEVRDLSTKELLRNVSLTVRRGEIVGLAGLVGAGRSELARAIFGADPISAGTILLEGKPVRIHHPGDAIRLGIGYVPEDRKRTGLLLGFPLFSNFTLPSLERYVRGGRISRQLEVRAFQRWATSLDIQARDPFEEARFLSGGNQQKVVLSKWMELSPRLLILDEPTRGVDVGAKVEIYEIMNRLAGTGTAILMISSDLPEVLGMADRIVVMHEGRVTGEFDRGAATKERVMEAAIA
jgi:ABC-type sugar transport system ATPase subunit